MRSIKRMALLAGGLLILIVGSACYRFALGSTWADDPVVIDGDDSDWTLPRRVLEGDRGVVGIMNDDTYLYISYRITSQVRIQQIVNQGLTIWIDPKGGMEKRIGFRYPIGSKLLGISPWDFDPRPRTTGYLAFLEQLLQLQPGVEVLGSRREDVALLPLENQVGLQARLQWTRDLFVYELRIPYGKRSDLPIQVGTAPGRKIGIGIVSGPLQADGLRKHREPMGVQLGEPMRPSGSGKGMDPHSEVLRETWITVTLATER